MIASYKNMYFIKMEKNIKKHNKMEEQRKVKQVNQTFHNE